MTITLPSHSILQQSNNFIDLCVIPLQTSYIAFIRSLYTKVYKWPFLAIYTLLCIKTLKTLKMRFFLKTPQNSSFWRNGSFWVKMAKMGFWAIFGPFWGSQMVPHLETPKRPKMALFRGPRKNFSKRAKIPKFAPVKPTKKCAKEWSIR